MSTRAGLNPKFTAEAYSPDERTIIYRFAQHFYVTRPIDAVRINDATYHAFLMRPADDMSVMLNVEREIIVLFSKYDTFEARTLTAYDKILNSFSDVRIDESVRLLVSADENIQSAIANFLAKDLEYPVIIPYKFSDFRLTTEEFLFTRIRSNHLIRDLFSHQSPLRNEYFFFGRDALVSGVIDLHRSGQNGSIFGLRKSGKTSTIYAIQRKAKGTGCRTVLVDCQDPSVHARRFNELLAYIIAEIRVSANLKRRDVNLGGDPAVVSDNFRKELAQTLGEIKADVLLIFDEIENISPQTAASPHWRDDRDCVLFWQILRAFFQKPPKYKVTFCFVGTNPSLLELPKIGDVENPVYLFAKPTFMPNLSFDEASNLMAKLGFFMGLDFPPAVRVRIHKLFGGHPFFTRQLCSQIHQIADSKRPKSVTLELCKRAEVATASRNETYVHDILVNLRTFYPSEYDMLQLLATDKLDDFHDLASSYPSLVEHLVGYGLITNVESQYELVFDVVRQVMQKGVKDATEPSLQEMRAEINRRRTVVEEGARAALFFWARRLTSEEWSDACTKCVPKLVEREGLLTPHQVFSKGNSPLYVLDLMQFVKFSKICDEHRESEVSGAFDCVNKCRADAHAKSISTKEFSDWRKAIEVLEELFMAPD